jgi:hypothetical protein
LRRGARARERRLQCRHFSLLANPRWGGTRTVAEGSLNSP